STAPSPWPRRPPRRPTSASIWTGWSRRRPADGFRRPLCRDGGGPGVLWPERHGETPMTDTRLQSQPQPEVKGGVIAYLQLDGALTAAELYARAFGAITVAATPPDDQGRTMHAHLHLNDGSLMLSDPYPEHDCDLVPPSG